MKTKRIILTLLVLLAALVIASCSSQEHFGRRKAPKDCHSCTRW